MTCSKCKCPIPLNHRPGPFLLIAGSTAAGAIIAWVTLDSPYNVVFGGALGLVAVISSGGVFTQMTDASSWVFFKYKKSGIECGACHHINPIYPWSL